MDNKTLVERVAEFQKLVKRKNGNLTAGIDRALIPLLEYAKSNTLWQISEEELITIVHSKQEKPPHYLHYLFRIFHGEDFKKVAEEVPEYVRRTHPVFGKVIPKDYENWNGSWDNAVNRNEGD